MGPLWLFHFNDLLINTYKIVYNQFKICLKLYVTFPFNIFVKSGDFFICLISIFLFLYWPSYSMQKQMMSIDHFFSLSMFYLISSGCAFLKLCLLGLLMFSPAVLTDKCCSLIFGVLGSYTDKDWNLLDDM